MTVLTAHDQGYYDGRRGARMSFPLYWSLEEKENYKDGWKEGWEVMRNRTKLVQGELFNVS